MENTEQITQLNTDLVAQQLVELEAIQATNESIANIPDEFIVADRTIKISSKSIRQMVKIDRAVLELHKIAYLTDESNLEGEELWEATIRKNENIYDRMVDVLFCIVNDNVNKPEFTKEWIEDNISAAIGSVGEQIIDAYNQKCGTDTTVKKMLMSRKF